MSQTFHLICRRSLQREGGPNLDIERALFKLEKVAIRYRKERGRPLCLIINNVHFIPDTDEGRGLLRILQQRAEAWADAGVCTFIFNSDDWHVFRTLKKNSTRMRVISIRVRASSSVLDQSDLTVLFQ